MIESITIFFKNFKERSNGKTFEIFFDDNFSPDPTQHFYLYTLFYLVLKKTL